MRGKKGIDTQAIYQDPKYSGKYVIVVNREIYTAKSGKSHTNLLEKVIKKYPDKKPLVMYVPKEDTLILIF